MKNMKCGKCKKLIIDYLEGVLPEDARLDMQEHLSKCETCAGAASDIEKNIASMKQLKDVKVPDLWPAIEEKLNEIEQPSPIIAWFGMMADSLKPYTIPAASFALILIISTILISRGDLFNRSKMKFIDVDYRTSIELSVYLREHKLPDNSAVSVGEMATLSEAIENGI
ncbi:anti-sigma factor family protein [Candidatus Auribacterota bacterium]